MTLKKLFLAAMASVLPPAFDSMQVLVYSSMEELLLSSYGQTVHYPKSTCNHPSVVRPRTTCDRS